jgi:prolyl-tRNA editing enzyme YbaK/EbsC (Cys-tRNA(Pro) deacylase)
MALKLIMAESELSSSARRVQLALEARGIACRVVELPDSTRTAVEAAQAIGCTVAQIAKSLIFKGEKSNQPVLVIASGSNRVDEKILRDLIGEKIGKADADFVRQHTGFAIGGIPPLGFPNPIRTFIDEDLLKFEEIWAAAGTPHAVCCLSSADLEGMTGGQVVRIAKAQPQV